MKQGPHMQMDMHRELRLEPTPIEYRKKELEELITAASVKCIDRKRVKTTARQYRFIQYAAPTKQEDSVKIEFTDPINLNAVTSFIQAGGLEEQLSVTDRKDEPLRDVFDAKGNRLFSYSGRAVLFPFAELLAKGQETYEKAMQHTVDLITKIHSDILLQDNPTIELHRYLPFLKEGITNYILEKELATIIGAMYDVSEGTADKEVSKCFIYTKNTRHKEDGKRTWMLKKQLKPAHISYIISSEETKDISVRFDVYFDMDEIETRIENQKILREGLELSDIQTHTLPKGTFVNGRALTYPINVPFQTVYNADGNELLRLEGKQMLHLRPRAEYSNREYLQAVTLANDIHEQMLFYTGALRDSKKGIGLTKEEFDVISLFSKLARFYNQFMGTEQMKKAYESGTPNLGPLEWIKEKMDESTLLEDVSKKIGYVAGEILKQVNLGRLSRYGPDADENLARLKLLEKQFSGN